jgi:hypothetical protein
MAALFTLGRIIMWPEAEASMRMQGINPASLLLRHMTGDWGDASDDQKRANNEAVREGGRILSAYEAGRRRLLVMTESDRSITIIMTFPEDA